MNFSPLYLIIGIGSALGGVARYGLGLLAVSAWGPEFPWGTIIINVAGSFIIGFFATITGPEGRLLVGTAARQFVMIGFCGGFTTFSSFSLETVSLLSSGRLLAAGANAGLSVIVCLFAVWLGHTLAQKLSL
jgi:CrcB protein